VAKQHQVDGLACISISWLSVTCVLHFDILTVTVTDACAVYALCSTDDMTDVHHDDTAFLLISSVELRSEIPNVRTEIRIISLSLSLSPS